MNRAEKQINDIEKATINAKERIYTKATRFRNKVCGKTNTA